MSLLDSIRADRATSLLIVLGTLLAGVGFTLSGVNMVRDNFVLVAVGFAFFVSGYKVSWFASHDITTFGEMKASVVDVFSSDDIKQELNFHLLTLTGILMASYGSTEFAQTIVAQGGMNPIVSGFIVFTGYMISHEGVNRVLV